MLSQVCVSFVTVLLNSSQKRIVGEHEDEVCDEETASKHNERCKGKARFPSKITGEVIQTLLPGNSKHF